MPPLAIGLDDIRAAYRRVPARTPFIFAIYIAGVGVRYYYMPGHCFGAISSVLNFNSYPEAMVAMARVLFAIPCDHYFDDYYVVDLRAAGFSAQACLATVHDLLIDLEADKRKDMAARNVALGVSVDVGAAHTAMCVYATATADRTRKVLSMLRAARDADRLYPAAAAVIRGKLGFLLSAAFSRIGRAATQPLLAREYYDDDTAFSPALAHMLEFFEVLLPRLPRLEMPLRRDARPPIVVYTDAMFRPAVAPRVLYDAVEIYYTGRPAMARAGFVVFDPLGGTYHSDMVLPPAFFAGLVAGDSTYILQAEIVAAIAVYTSMPRLFAGRPVLHFIDNTGALSLLVHGYSSRVDCARLVNAFHLVHAALRFEPWFEWVPSAANIADLPSRGAYTEYRGLLPHSVAVPFVLPNFATFAGPLHEFYNTVMGA